MPYSIAQLRLLTLDYIVWNLEVVGVVYKVPVGSNDELEEGLVILADVWLLVVAGDVMPLDAILVEIVEHSQAGLGSLVDPELCVIRLRSLVVSSAGPRVGVPGPPGGGGVSGGDLPVDG